METIEQFTERMSQVEFKKQYVVGRTSSGDTRSIYDFEGQTCFLESRGYRNISNRQTQPATPAQMLYIISSEPTDYWVHAKDIYGKSRAKRLAKHYGASNIEECPYCNNQGEWFYFTFDKFEDLMKMVYDIYTGNFLELWGDVEKEQEALENA